MGVGGSTGDVLQRSLSALRDLISRSLAEVRLRRRVRDRTQFRIAEFIEELVSAAALEADARGLSFRVVAADAGAIVDADRPILAASVSNLLHNAFKFTRPGSTVTLRSSATTDRVLLEVEDECGGLPGGNVADLSSPSNSAVRTAPGWALVWRSAAGGRRRTTAASLRVTCPITGVSSPSTSRGWRSPSRLTEPRHRE